MKRILFLTLVFFLSGNCFGGAIAQWKMNDSASNTTVADSVGSYTGTFHGTGGVDDYTSAHTTTGQINAAFDLDGTNDYITVSDDSVFTPDGTPMSITAWVSLSADEGALDFMIANKMGTALEWDFCVSSDALYFTLYDESASQAKIGRYDSTSDYSLYEGSGFIFVAGTYDGGALCSGVKLYLNGENVDDSDDKNGTFANVDNSNEDIYIGKFDISMAKGAIDNLVIYNTELTEAQVLSLYNNGVGTEEVGLGSVAENIERARTKYGYRKYYRNRY